ncbi:MAG TPA: hypothetical protein PK129_06375 [Cellvibrionaceae bacterium]|nr:hypothetical protein [Cellvibrionaceae bacterium]
MELTQNGTMAIAIVDSTRVITEIVLASQTIGQKMKNLTAYLFADHSDPNNIYNRVVWTQEILVRSYIPTEAIKIINFTQPPIKQRRK